MNRKWIRASLVAAFAAAAVAASVGTVVSADEKTPTIKEIMVKGHKGTDAYISKIGAEAKGGKWDEAQQHAKGLAYFGETLSKLTPGKGDKSSWETQTAKYAEQTKAVLKATEAKDAKGTQAALGMMQKSCSECHKAHKGK